MSFQDDIKGLERMKKLQFVISDWPKGVSRPQPQFFLKPSKPLGGNKHTTTNRLRLGPPTSDMLIEPLMS